MSDPALSVVIATRNRPEKLRRLVETLGSQHVHGLMEVLVVDDGSDPPVMNHSVGGAVPTRVVRLTGVERSAARNAGARRARGATLLFLDDDMVPSSGLVDQHLRAQSEWRDCLAVGAVSLARGTHETLFGRFRCGLEEAATPSARGPVSRPNFAAAANMSIPTERFIRLCGFDEAMSSAEDQDLALRHSAAGGTIVFLPEAHALHDDSSMDLRSYCRRHELGAEHMVPFLRRHPDWPENRERLEVNGPVRWGKDKPRDVGKKLLKGALASAPTREALLTFTEIVERAWPASPYLMRLYRICLGLHIFRGFRRGLRHGASAAPGRGASLPL